ncbi:unnamed protein product [Heligmosomoides polygyrus]|uniref:ABC transporter domain-containing protein n=1 Tax=Heligmosomoides polygyrus TaxID=6339 RepID=A0A3P8BY01_HELPZ|nr:unnamed protein product [Heligmosomoides polygyrus]
MVLDHVYGSAMPSEIMAVMGPSGAGKTCLLNVLAHRNLGTLQVQGSVRVNQGPVTKEFMRSACAYVQQEDCFIGSLTVKEHLIFSKYSNAKEVIQQGRSGPFQSDLRGLPGQWPMTCPVLYMYTHARRARQCIGSIDAFAWTVRKGAYGCIGTNYASPMCGRALGCRKLKDSLR